MSRALLARSLWHGEADPLQLMLVLQATHSEGCCKPLAVLPELRRRPGGGASKRQHGRHGRQCSCAGFQL